MKYRKKIFYLSLLFLLGCQNEEIVSPEISFDEYIVVQCELEGNNNFSAVRLTKTLPIGVSFNIKNAEITDATLYLRINEIKIVPLHYKIDGLYKPLYEFKVKEGDIYELFGEKGSQTFYSRTIIPYKPKIYSSWYNLGGAFGEASVKSQNNEVYSAIWIMDLTSIKYAPDFYDVFIPKEVSEISTITVRSSSFPVEYQGPEYQGKRYMQVYSFDKAFDKYFQTKIQSSTINNPYVQGTSGTTIWNIEGDKVIGMFIGFTKGDVLNLQ